MERLAKSPLLWMLGIVLMFFLMPTPTALASNWQEQIDAAQQNKNELEQIMDAHEKELKGLKGEQSDLQKQLSELKQGWVDGMMISIGSEAHNRQAFEEAGVLNDYMYLIEKNPTLLKHSVAFNVYKEGNQTIPDELWEQLVKPSKEFVQEYK